MVFALSVSFEIGAVEVDFAKIASAVTLGLIVEVGRCWIATFSTCRDGLGVNFVTELDDSDEAVSAGTIPFLRSGIGARSERSE